MALAILYIFLLLIKGFLIAGALIAFALWMRTKKLPKNKNIRTALLALTATAALILVVQNTLILINLHPGYRRIVEQTKMIKQQEEVASFINFPLYSSPELKGINPRYRFVYKYGSAYLITSYPLGNNENLLQIYQYANGKIPYTLSSVNDETCKQNKLDNCRKIKDTTLGELFEISTRYEKTKDYLVKGSESSIFIDSEKNININQFLGKFKQEDTHYFINTNN